MGVKAEGHNLIELVHALIVQAPNTHWLTLAVGVLAQWLPEPRPEAPEGDAAADD